MQQQAIIERNKLVWYSYRAILIIVGLTGLGFLIYRFAAGLGSTTNLGSVIPWGLWLVLYIFFIGLSVGSFLLSTLTYVFHIKKYERIGRLALYSAAVSLVIGGIFVIADLGHAERMWEVLTNFASNSVLWFEILFMGLYLVIIVMSLYFLTRTDRLSRDRDMKMVMTLGIIGIPLALAVQGSSGALFAVVKAISHWHTPLLPIIFISSALVSGTALLLVLRAFFTKPTTDETSFLSGLSKLVLGLLALEWLLIISEFLVVFYGAVPDAVAPLREMLAGDSWWVFWLVQLGIGFILPVYLILLKGKSAKVLGLAGLAVVIGIAAVRWNVVIPGQVAALKLEGLTEAFSSARFEALYSPTAIEWLSSLGILALFMGLISVGLKFLPLQTDVENTPESKGGR